VFSELFLVFLAIGTTVGILVVLYTVYNMSKSPDEEKFDAPQLGELPTGQSSGKSKKLFVSFGLSAILVISVVIYSYSLLLYVENGPDGANIETQGEDVLNVQVTGFQFGWEYQYPNGQSAFTTLRVPAGEEQVVRLQVTSDDVWHQFGSTDLRVKADSIPGQNDTTWFIAGDAGETYTVECFELCGAGHSQMEGEIMVMEPDAFNEWYEGTYEGAASQEASS
jgi:cytochrome c oxidase subunit 2